VLLARGSEAQLRALAYAEFEERRRAEARLEHASRYDALTGLANRAQLVQELRAAAAGAEARSRFVAVALLDIDNFKSVNGPLGHDAGDALLRTVAARLKRVVRASDTVARIGGDSFAFVLGDLAHPADAARAAEKIVASFHTPLYSSCGPIRLTATVGLSVHPTQGSGVDGLLRDADIAMQRARERGQAYQFHAREMTESARARLELERDLHLALERQEFVLHYQPYYEAAGGLAAGAEALIRWRHPERGIVEPSSFIPLAEETGLIVPLGAWVLETACAEAARWGKAGADIPVAVNLSARQFGSRGLVDTVAAALVRNGLSPRRLTVEITESALLGNTDEVLRTLTALKALGVAIAIDDFGTCYSSLNYIKRFGPDYLKVDRSFVQGVATNDNDAAIASAIVGLAHALRMRVVAEGVETAEQAQALRRLRCDYLQGFHFAKPLCAPDLLDRLRFPPRACGEVQPVPSGAARSQSVFCLQSSASRSAVSR